jgi:hypothetical protein
MQSQNICEVGGKDWINTAVNKKRMHTPLRINKRRNEVEKKAWRLLVKNAFERVPKPCGFTLGPDSGFE